MTHKLTFLFFFAFVVFTVTPVGAQSNFFVLTVNSTADSFDAMPGDFVCADALGRCTLRAALDEANLTPRRFIVFNLPNPSTITLTLGELQIRQGIEIYGPGSRKLTIARSAAAGNFRIFNINRNDLRLSSRIHGLTLSLGAGTGGAVHVGSESSTFLSDVRILQNAGVNGAGIYNAGSLTVARSLFQSNGSETANAVGGAIFNAAGATLIVENSTFTNNRAIEGGAIFNAGTLTLANNTFSDNRATSTGAAVHSNSTGQVRVLNTIFGRDLSSNATSLNGAFTSFGNNIVCDNRNSQGFIDGVNGDRVSSANGIDPGLGALADNGGSTDSIAPIAGSLAIDAGNSCVFSGGCNPALGGLGVVADQRWERRRFGSSVDIGAVEFSVNPSPLVPELSVSSLGLKAPIMMEIVDTMTLQLSRRPMAPSATRSTVIGSSLAPQFITVRSKRPGFGSAFVHDPLQAPTRGILNGNNYERTDFVTTHQ